LRTAIGEHGFFFENADGRIVLLLPLDDRVLLGTTDIRVDDPDKVTVTEEEVGYLLNMVGRVFPRIEVDESHIVFAFSGVRPLASSKASLTGQISRDHKIEVEEAGGSPEFPVLSLVGGKWTTFRALAEQASNQVLQRLGISRKISTVDIEIGGGRDYPDTRQHRENWILGVSAESGLSRECVEALFSRYGTGAARIAKHISTGGDQALNSYPSFSSREIDHIVQNEDVVHLDDFLLRRSMIGILGRNSKAGLNELGRLIGGVNGWDEARIRNEIQRTIHILKSRHRVDLDRYQARYLNKEELSQE
jgi:glycerol-3-phosphate dehydrogenase